MNCVKGALGFRIKAEIHLKKNPSPTKCLVFIDTEKFSTITDVASHIRNIFSIKNEVQLYIDDMLLPDCETINIIQKDDILIVKVISSKVFTSEKESTSTIEEPPKEQEFSSTMTETSTVCDVKKKTSKKKRELSLDMDTENEITDCFRELEKKKEALVNKTSKNLVEPTGDYSPEYSYVESEVEQLKKKRKRKHKKKSKTFTNDVEHNESISSHSNMFEALDTSNIIVPPHKILNKHVYFSDADETSQTAVLGEHHVDNSEEIEEIRSKLTSLASKPKSEKVFTRNCDSASKSPQRHLKGHSSCPEQNLAVEKNVPSTNESKNLITTPVKGDTIRFRILKMSSDYSPIISEEIIGRIINVEEHSDTPQDKKVVLDIFSGSEEFQTPQGIFSLDMVDDETNENDKLIYKTLNWSEIREPTSCIFPVLNS